MAVKIRLRRQGSHKQPTYRVVVADVRSPRDGSFIEVIGHYNPRTDPTTIVIDAQKALKWLRQGAQPTEVVTRLMTKTGIMDQYKSGTTGSQDTAPATSDEPVSASSTTEENAAEA